MADSQGSSASVTVDDLDNRLKTVESSLESLKSSVNTISSIVGTNESGGNSLTVSVENLNNQFKTLTEGSSEGCSLHSLELAINDFNATIFELVQPSIDTMNNSLTELQAFVPTLKQYSDSINTAKANLVHYQELMNYFTRLEANRDNLLQKFSESEKVIQTLAAADSRLQQLTTAATKLEKMYASIANQTADASQLEQLYARNVEAVSSLSETLDELYALRASLSKQMTKVNAWVEKSDQIQSDVDQKIAEMKKLQSLDLVNAVSNAISASATVAVASRHSKTATTEDNRKSL
jgi:DNA repair ATPase RecN